jgi:hypothetical protein
MIASSPSSSSSSEPFDEDRDRDTSLFIAGRALLCQARKTRTTERRNGAELGFRGTNGLSPRETLSNILPREGLFPNSRSEPSSALGTA